MPPLKSGLKFKIPPPCCVPSAAAEKVVENEKDSTSTPSENTNDNINIPTGTSKPSKTAGKCTQSTQKSCAPKKVLAA